MEDYLGGREEKKGDGDEVGKRGRVNKIKVHCIHTWKCHNETTILYDLKKDTTAKGIYWGRWEEPMGGGKGQERVFKGEYFQNT
jgi:hypothetical protein